jgi:hypothetical protein
MLFLILISFFNLLTAGSANEDDKPLNDSEYSDVPLPLPDYGPKFFDENKKNPQFITSRGSFPETVNDDEIVDFFSDPVYKCWSNMTEIDQFFAGFDDLVIGFNHAGGGYLIVELESAFSEKVNETTINEIYQRIDDYCEQEGVSEIPVVFMWSHIDKPLPLPDYGPQVFEAAKKLPGFITARGTMPEIHQEEEKWKWINSLVNGSQSLSPPGSTAELNPYFAVSGGPVNSFGADINGYLIVGFEPSAQEKVNESLIDKIYQVIDEHFEQEGISDVPVVFTFINITDDSAPANGSEVNESNDANLSYNKEKIDGNETPNQMPGFTSIMVILGLLSLLIIKRP